ncbi:DUF3429 domain-containing protein [Afifella sp. JA880]|uniref:DUF3429 domain-containing protein n=1 Tax=Afifella sp. JA880 TaxID=2975280 RepID=UPI0021BBA88D|nr:DUF3429 domain-containing protein [Afifella sp. JA880]MCT8266457.1 DUF3429 domain-containing protein [Afifella sp. JA880]
MPTYEKDGRSLEISEPARTPGLSIFLGYGAMLPITVGALAVLVLPDDAAEVVLSLTTIWGAVVLIFLGGVRRGLSFRTEAGPTITQLVMTFWLFGLGLVSLLLGPGSGTLLLLLAGYVRLAIVDPLSARRGEAPLFFARLRPLQMLVPIASFVVLLLWVD